MVLIGIIGLLVFASAVFMLVRAIAGTDAPIGTVEQIQSYGYQSDAAKSPESPKRSLAELAASIGTRTRNSRFAMGEEDMRALLVQAGHVLDLPRPPARATRCSSPPGSAS